MNEPTLVTHRDVSLPALHIAGLSCRTHDGEAGRTIPALWQRVLAARLPARLPGVPARLPSGSGVPLVGVYHAYESDHRGPYTLTVGVPVAGPVALPDEPDLAIVDVPAQPCAHLSAAGERPRSVFAAWTHVWEELTARRSFRVDLEVYWPERGETGAVDLYVGLR